MARRTSSGARLIGSKSNVPTVPAGLVWPGGAMRAPAGQRLERLLRQPLVLAELLEPGPRERRDRRRRWRRGAPPDADRVDRRRPCPARPAAVDVVEAQPERGDPLGDTVSVPSGWASTPAGRRAGERDERLAAVRQLRGSSSPARRGRPAPAPRRRRPAPAAATARRPTCARSRPSCPTTGRRTSPSRRRARPALVAVEDDVEPRPTSACDHASGSARSRPRSTLKRPSS